MTGTESVLLVFLGVCSGIGVDLRSRLDWSFSSLLDWSLLSTDRSLLDGCCTTKTLGICRSSIRLSTTTGGAPADFRATLFPDELQHDEVRPITETMTACAHDSRVATVTISESWRDLGHDVLNKPWSLLHISIAGELDVLLAWEIEIWIFLG